MYHGSIAEVAIHHSAVAATVNTTMYDRFHMYKDQALSEADNVPAIATQRTRLLQAEQTLYRDACWRYWGMMDILATRAVVHQQRSVAHWTECSQICWKIVSGVFGCWRRKRSPRAENELDGVDDSY